MTLTIKKPSSSKIVWMLIFLAFLKPAYFGTIAELDQIFNVIRIVAVVLLLIYYLIRKHRIFMLSALLLLYSVIPLFSTFINEGNIINAFTLCAVSFGSAMVMDIAAQKRNDMMVDALYSILEILVYANLITIILFPHGLYLFTTESGWISDQTWVLGLRNAQTTYLLLACIVDVTYWYIKPRRVRTNIRCICLYTAVFITINHLKVGSGYLSYFLMTILFIVMFFKKSICLSFKIVVIAHIVMFFFLTSVGKLSPISTLGDALGLIVGRTGTVSARFQIWTISWDKILESPLWGHGALNLNQLTWLSTIAAGATTTHNTFLDMWFRGGLFCFGSFCMILVYINKRLNFLKVKNQNLYNVCSIGFFGFFIVAQAEGALSGATMYVLIGMIWALPTMIEARENET